ARRSLRAARDTRPAPLGAAAPPLPKKFFDTFWEPYEEWHAFENARRFRPIREPRRRQTGALDAILPRAGIFQTGSFKKVLHEKHIFCVRSTGGYGRGRARRGAALCAPCGQAVVPSLRAMRAGFCAFALRHAGRFLRFRPAPCGQVFVPSPAPCGQAVVPSPCVMRAGFAFSPRAMQASFCVFANLSHGGEGGRRRGVDIPLAGVV
ncbi:MAG TPA: hypothetical protein H9737_01950, partial [Candidatus Borkfalkia faecigallinarum]|nr:hypothetical protein [Candidatus Borkfalkia faecigallinarum]